MLFEQANIVSVNLADNPGAVPAVTRIEIASERFEDDVRAVSERFFGEAEVVVSGTITDGVDAVVILGSDFLVQRANLLEIEREQAASAATSVPDDDDGADFDVSAEAAGDDAGDDSDVEETVSTDTVPGDE